MLPNSASCRSLQINWNRWCLDTLCRSIKRFRSLHSTAVTVFVSGSWQCFCQSSFWWNHKWEQAISMKRHAVAGYKQLFRIKFSFNKDWEHHKLVASTKVVLEAMRRRYEQKQISEKFSTVQKFNFESISPSVDSYSVLLIISSLLPTKFTILQHSALRALSFKFLMIILVTH